MQLRAMTASGLACLLLRTDAIVSNLRQSDQSRIVQEQSSARRSAWRLALGMDFEFAL